MKPALVSAPCCEPWSWSWMLGERWEAVIFSPPAPDRDASMNNAAALVSFQSMERDRNLLRTIPISDGLNHRPGWKRHLHPSPSLAEGSSHSQQPGAGTDAAVPGGLLLLARFSPLGRAAGFLRGDHAGGHGACLLRATSKITK